MFPHSAQELFRTGHHAIVDVQHDVSLKLALLVPKGQHTRLQWQRLSADGFCPGLETREPSTRCVSAAVRRLQAKPNRVLVIAFLSTLTRWLEIERNATLCVENLALLKKRGRHIETFHVPRQLRGKRTEQAN